MIRDTQAMDRELASPPWWRRRLGTIAAAIAGVVLLALAWPMVARWSGTDRSVARAQLRYGTVVRGTLVHAVAVEGRVVAASRPTLFSPAQGIVSLRVAEGERVTTGQLLAEVESPQLESRLGQERAGLAALESGLGRLQLESRKERLEDRQAVELAEVREAAAARLVERDSQLHDLGLVNQIDLEASRDAHTVATLELEQARQQLEMNSEIRELEERDARATRDRQRLLVADLERQVGELELRAPFDGLVATLAVEDRDAVINGQPLVGVVDLADLEVEVEIPEVSADEVATGTPAVITLGGEEHRGRVTRVAPEVRGGVVLGRVAFVDGVPPGLRQNQRVSTRLVLDRREDVLKVPRGPFLEAGGGHQAWVVEDGIARRRPIETGAASVSEVEVVGGLAVGDEIVLSDMSRFGDAEAVLLRN